MTMNEEEAKLILQCRRPRGQDDQDAAIREALGMVSGDSAAMELLRQEEELDAVIGERLRSVEPPGDLRRKILVGARVTPRVRHWWPQRKWLAAAAGLAFGIPAMLKYGLPRTGTPIVASALNDFRAITTRKLSDGPKLEKFETVEKVRAHLADHSKTKNPPLPAHLCECTQGTAGCEVFEWNGSEVILICFKADGNRIVHLFSVDASAVEPMPEKCVCVPLNGWHTLTWTEGGKLMMLAGGEKETSEKELRSMME
jgi:hypothetical protein